MWDYISQVTIALLCPFSVFLTARKNGWGFVVGLAAQPCWFITTYLHEQWGVMAITVLYCFIYLYGIWVWFIGRQKNEVPPTFTRRSPEDRKMLDLLAKQLMDSKSVVILIKGRLSAEVIGELLGALDGVYKSLGGQELRFEFTPEGLIAKPYDEPNE